jgi:hypothetical protein
MTDDRAAAYRQELDSGRLAHLYEMARDRRKQIGELALLGLKSLILLNGGAIVALFTVLAHFDQLAVVGWRLWLAFGCFCTGVVLALCGLLVGFFSSNANWLAEQASGDFIYFHSLGDADNVALQQAAQQKASKLGGKLWSFAAGLAAISILTFAAGSGVALWAVQLKSSLNDQRPQGQYRGHTSGTAAVPIRSSLPDCKAPESPDQALYCFNQNSANAAQAQAMWAFWQLLVGVVGLIGLGLTVLYAGRAWKEAQRSAKTAEKALVSIERAFVFLDGFDVELTTAADSKSVNLAKLPPHFADDPDLFITRFAVLPRWKNSGNTPTKKMTIQANAGAARFGLDPNRPFEPIYDYGRERLAFALGPGATETSNELELPGAGEIISHSFSPVGDPPLYLIWGRAEYADVFGNQHFVEWCYRLRFERHDGKALRAHFIQWGNYNRTEDREP